MESVKVPPASHDQTTLNGQSGSVNIVSADTSVSISAGSGNVDLSVPTIGAKIPLSPVNTHPSGAVGTYQQTSNTFDVDVAKTLLNKRTFGGISTTKIFRVLANTQSTTLVGQVRVKATPSGGGATTVLATVAIDTDNVYEHFSTDITTAINNLAAGEYHFECDFKVTTSDSSNNIQVKEMYIEVYH